MQTWLRLRYTAAGNLLSYFSVSVKLIEANTKMGGDSIVLMFDAYKRIGIMDELGFVHISLSSIQNFVVYKPQEYTNMSVSLPRYEKFDML